MNKIRCLVVDDEELARTLLKTYIERLPYLELKALCRDSIEAMVALQQYQIDLMFLDIQMPELTGVEFLKTLTHKPVVIFTTAYPDYALEGYQLDVTDYLLKPFSFERFIQAVNKATELIKLRQGVSTTPDTKAHPTFEDEHKGYLLVKAEHKVHRIKLEDILYIQSMREYVSIHTPTGRILSLNSLKNLEEELPSDQFIRIHKSYIIAIDKVKTLEGNLVHIADKKLPIGANYRQVFLDRMF